MFSRLIRQAVEKKRKLMKKRNSASSTSEWGKAKITEKKERYILRLYVTGTSPQSSKAIANIREICEEHLKGRYDLEVIDLYQHPELAKGEQIIAAPTLVKKLPLPLRRVIGDLSATDRVLVGLDLREG